MDERVCAWISTQSAIKLGCNLRERILSTAGRNILRGESNPKQRICEPNKRLRQRFFQQQQWCTEHSRCDRDPTWTACLFVSPTCYTQLRKPVTRRQHNASEYRHNASEYRRGESVGVRSRIDAAA